MELLSTNGKNRKLENERKRLMQRGMLGEWKKVKTRGRRLLTCRDNPIRFGSSFTTTFPKVWKTLSSTGSKNSRVAFRLKKSEKVGYEIRLIIMIIGMGVYDLLGSLH